MFEFISQAIISIGLAIGSFLGFYNEPAPAEFGATNLIAGSTYTLSGGGISSSATSLVLSSFTIPQTGQKVQDSDLSDTFYLTIEPGNRSRQEVISCTTVVQGATTATLSGCVRGISPVRPYTASSTLQFAHAGGTQVIFSDPPNVFDEMANVQNTAYITGAWGFQGTAPTSTTCATANELCNKSYVDATANAGAATSTETNGGIVELGTLAEQSASFDGGANKPTVLQTKNATSTCQVAGNYSLIASSTTGKLSQSCFDTSGSLTYTGTNTFTATTTMATTTVASSTVTNLNVSNDLSVGGTINGDGSALTNIQTLKLLTSTTTQQNMVYATTTFSAAAHLMVVINIAGASAASGMGLAFNSDYAANYGIKDFVDGVIVTAAGQGYMAWAGNSATTSPGSLVFNIKNNSSQRKIATWEGGFNNSADNPPILYTGIGVWNNTSSQITTLTIVGAGGQTITAGSTIHVYGSPN